MAIGITPNQLTVGWIPFSVEFDNDDIIALGDGESGELILVPAVADKIIVPIVTIFSLNNAAGVYTAGTPQWYLLYGSGGIQASNYVADVSSILTNANTHIRNLNGGPSFAGAGDIDGYHTGGGGLSSGMVNKALVLEDDWNGAVYGGGNIANTLKVQGIYTLITP